MLKLFSPRVRHSTWRQLWLWLAQGEKNLGLDIPDTAISGMESHLTVTDEDFSVAAEEEKRRRHDVMAHVHAFGVAVPAAAGIIHLGATSCFVTDGAEQILQRQALDLLLPKLAGVVANLKAFAVQYRDLPCLAFTHGQPAQPTTVGKRACLWTLDLLTDLRNLERVRADIRFRGAKGTTGTQASYLELFAGDHAKVEALDAFVTQKAGFDTPCPITSQTYSRKQDLDAAAALASFAATASKMAGDLRHLSMLDELREPIEAAQIGSSAMPYKQNPMRAERISSLARLLLARAPTAAATYAAQWLERSLDDSAARRVDLPETYLLADAVLRLLDNVTAGLRVFPAMIARNLARQLPFMATEVLIVALADKGVSRQAAHERIRVHARAAAQRMYEEAGPAGERNDMMDRVRADAFFAPIRDELDGLLDPHRFVGRAPQQVDAFVAGDVARALEPYREALGTRVAAELNV